MSNQRLRSATGGVGIDRNRPVRFSFDGKAYDGFAGDTLASALLANGVRLVGRSFKYHRPRGVLSSGSDEPNALVTVGSGRRMEPNARATTLEIYDGLEARSQNAWPSLNFDLAAINSYIAPFIPAGFYYKTFIGGPKNAWTRLYEPSIRRMAGLGKAPDAADADVYDKRHAHCDVLIVGSGASGLSAALAASARGASVIIIDEQSRLGGALHASGELIEGAAASLWAQQAGSELSARDNCRILTRTTAFGRYDHGLVMAVERRTDHDPARSGPRQRLWQIRAKKIILATGAHQQPLLFGNNDLPGVMLAQAGQTYARQYGVLAGRRIVVGTVDAAGAHAAQALADAGAEVVAIVDGREAGASAFQSHHRAAIVRAIGGRKVEAADILSESGNRSRIACDAVLMSGGWQPALHLFSHVGGKTRYDAALDCFVASNSVDDVRLAGACAGTFDLESCLLEGDAAGRDAHVPAATVREVPSAPFRGTPEGKTFVDFQNDVTLADIDLAAREGFVSVEHLKRYTTTGMATDQGKTSNLNALKRMSGHLAVEPGTVGTTTFRPPYTPVTFGALAGVNVGSLMAPTRYTPMHEWHEANGALFENVGQWKRAWYYPRAGENMDEAVRRECRAVRQNVGMFDASTLGKIDIRGPDASKFLNLVYTNAWSKLDIGRCRYGLMLGEDGMVMDDGVTIRTGPDRYLMTTTSGNAAPVMEYLEDLLQTEWPDLRVYLTSVTEHWAACVVTGPRARNVLERVVKGLDLSNEAFPHLSMREAVIGETPARIYRISFTGELSYEVHVPAQFGAAIWKVLYDAGQPFGLTPYGTEATHVLRAEKGYVIIGQETDGTATPIDLGLDWAIAKSKADFIGKRSLARPDTARADRKQLVGLRPVDGRTVLKEGAQLVGSARVTAPVPMQGHVSSSYWADASGGPIALALLKGGRNRHGEVIYAWSDGATVACEVCPPIFYDPEGARLHA